MLANDVGEFFVRKVEHISQDTDSICLSSADRNLVPPDGEASDITDEVLRSCGNLSERNVCELIRASAKKSCLLDPFPTNVVCDSLNVLLPVITNMVNASLSTGHFPDNWKEAIINPLFKRALLISLTRTCVRLVISNLCPRLLKEQPIIRPCQLTGNHIALRRRWLR